jgi:hypothetical protein
VELESPVTQAAAAVLAQLVLLVCPVLLVQAAQAQQILYV